ncbi:hypothetical protein KIL84_005549 [Mauremys mutica]|uniref:Uncharacterized protein n=1 Tax=Mauremys mutica TaxID=74926 RepID=A0A9D3WQC2_9SAUR|nr:hypothetical protein KIL84_008141 [Mauremys mutica]KAH1164799.1 hypothetical protein KIL84_005549 [Mauremys mutica]
MAFVTGALGLWVPLFLDRAQVVHDLVPPCLQEPCKSPNSLIFGGITIATGIVGVISGAAVARKYKKINTKADPLICAMGMFCSAPFLYLSIMLAARSIVATYVQPKLPLLKILQAAGAHGETFTLKEQLSVTREPRGQNKSSLFKMKLENLLERNGIVHLSV